jgi:hydrogenase/urease accessory protein HupE
MPLMRRGLFFMFTLLLIAASAAAHPTIQNGLDVVVSPQQLSINARINLQQIDIANPLGADTDKTIDPKKLAAAVDAHGQYLAAHLHIRADGVAVPVSIVKPEPPTGPVTWSTYESQYATYELNYVLENLNPKHITISQDALKEYQRLGQPWTVLFAATVRQQGSDQPTQFLLSREDPMEFDCTWSAAAPPQRSGLWHTAWQYTLHGLHHILTGYDHLLFVAALVLGATKLWDLVKVVTAFAIAHTLTLTLSVLNVVRLPPSIVEPMIAASIVFVALQNVFFPKPSRGTARLIIAFGFGLFHGLGFAGGLLEAMHDMPTINLAAALVAFSIGVELAHQILIVPLFFISRSIRTSASWPQRITSGAISAAGMFYLVVALHEAIR